MVESCMAGGCPSAYSLLERRVLLCRARKVGCSVNSGERCVRASSVENYTHVEQMLPRRAPGAMNKTLKQCSPCYSLLDGPRGRDWKSARQIFTDFGQTFRSAMLMVAAAFRQVRRTLAEIAGAQGEIG